MDTTAKSYQLSAGDDVLRTPFVVNVKDMGHQNIDALLDSMMDKLGAQLFRDKSLFLEVLHDKFEKAKDTSKYLYGPYVGVVITEKNVVRLTSVDAPEGGMTVYAPEQYLALADSLDEPINVKPSVRRAGPRP